MNADQAREMYNPEEEDCSPECKEWMGKIDEAMQARAKKSHSMRYVFPSFSESLERHIDDKYGPEALKAHRRMICLGELRLDGFAQKRDYMTHKRCALALKQKYRERGCTVSSGVYHYIGSSTNSRDFLDISWNTGWWDTYYDWKDRWWGSVKSERG